MVNGANIVRNSGFEEYVGALIDSGSDGQFSSWQKSGSAALSMVPVTSTDVGVGGTNVTAVRLSGAGTDAVHQQIDTGHALYERTFVASIHAKATSSCTAKLVLGSDVTSPSVDITVGTTWQTYGVTLSIPSDDQVTSTSNVIDLALQLNTCGGAGLEIDNAQVEESTQASTYKDYGSTNILHLNATRKSCSPDDVGCQAYKPVAGGPVVTGQVRESDRCAADKVGCARYHLEAISTFPQRAAADVNIVAPKGKQCSAADVGCEEYTNLDIAGRGGEGKSYFKQVKQCVKPTNTQITQSTYYTWVGDPQKGFVLRAYQLVKTNLGSNGDAPCTSLSVATSGTNPQCNDTDATVTAAQTACQAAADLATNANCAEYFDSDLVTYYRLRSSTVSVTADCTPFRNTIDSGSGQDKVYYLSPKENVSCSAGAAYCRAYTGNNGKTTRQIIRDSFDAGTTTNWIGGTPSTAAVNPGGRSMLIQGAGGGVAYTRDSALRNQISRGKSYLVTFIAAAANNSAGTITAAFGLGSGSSFTASPNQNFSGTAVTKWNEGITPPGPEWHSYTLGPLVMPRDAEPSIALGLITTNEVYIDDLTLTEINDSVYLISNSVPSCADADLGCAAYKDKAGQSQYLKSFSRICSADVVGCEALIDTQNSSASGSTTVKGVTTPGDTIVTLVNNSAAYCNGQYKGCEAFGQPIDGVDGQVADFKTVYLKNDPDRYTKDICLPDELYCRAYTIVGGGAAFFKDPKSQICEYRSDNSLAGGKWYIKGTSVSCPTVAQSATGRPLGASCAPSCVSGARAGKFCSSDTDCPGSLCGGDQTAIGLVTGGVIGQCADDSSCSGAGRCAGGPNAGRSCSANSDCPSSSCAKNTCQYYAGSCPDGQNGCTEYRDPSDPVSCRSECPLVQQGASPVYVDATCTPTRCQNSTDPKVNGRNCQTNEQCGDGACVGANNLPSSGFPGCRSYYYLRQSIEGNATECNGQVDPKLGCQPFYDTSKSDVNFRGQ